MLGALVIFMAGSAISGSATSMNVLIVGRAIQGVGGGAIESLANIITADLVPLRQRGLFYAITGVTYTFGSVIGPFIAGALTQDASWRWLFYMNLPLCAVSMVLLGKLDWIGNICITASTCAFMLGMTWGGVRFPWTSPRVLVPLITGVVGMVGAMIYETRWAKDPTIPLDIMPNRTSIVGYFATFVQGVAMITSGFYFPTWIQSVRLADPITTGLDFLPMMLAISPCAALQGVFVAKFGHYRALILVAWGLSVLGTGLLTILNVHTGIGVVAVFEMIQGSGFGLLYATYYPALAGVPLGHDAAAVAFLTFLRTFSQAWGVAISGTILQDSLKTRLPTALLAELPDGVQIAYSIIPQIKTFSPAQQEQIRTAFAESFTLIWKIMAGVCGLGLLSTSLIQDIPLRKVTDKEWGFTDKGDAGQHSGADVEKSDVDSPAPLDIVSIELTPL